MFEDDFYKMLRDYPQALTDKKMLTGLMRDLFAGQQMQINLMTTAYELGIAEKIANAAQITNALAFRFVKQLVEDYGVSRANADWAVSVWCVCYGQRLLHKPCDISLQQAKSGPAICEERPSGAGKQYGDLFRYAAIEDGYGVIGFSGQDKRTIVFPNRHQNRPVKRILPRAFAECEVEDAVIPDGIEWIDDGAFNGCARLKQVIFPETLKEIGAFAFASCSNLLTATLPKNVRQIGKYAFADSGLKSAALAPSVYWIGEGAYANCANLASAEIPNGMLALPDKMFFGCKNLTEVKLPVTLESIGAEAFAVCENLKSIAIPENVRTIGVNAFSGTHPKFTLQCKRLSAAEQYARENNIPFQLIV